MLSIATASSFLCVDFSSRYRVMHIVKFQFSPSLLTILKLEVTEIVKICLFQNDYFALYIRLYDY